MRKLKKGRKLSRKRDQRKALLKALVSAVFLNGKIKTTEAKAKEISPIVEKFITRASKNDISVRRLLGQNLSKKIVKKLVDEIAPKYKERKGGYTRIIKLGPRKGDGAKMAVIELVE